MNTYKLLAQEIIVSLIKDYRRGDDTARQQIRGFAREQSTVIVYLARAYGVSIERLQEYLLSQLDQTEQQQVL